MANAKKKIGKGKKIALIVSASFLSAIALSYGGLALYYLAPLSSYYAASKKAFWIPGTNEGLIAQGIGYDEASSLFAVCGYQEKGPSRVALVDKESGETKKTLDLLLEDGSSNACHAGGIAVHGDYVYLCHSSSSSKNALDVYSWAEMRETSESSVKRLGQISLRLSDEDYLKPSWASVAGDSLLIGEFYLDGDYETCPSHARGDSHALAVSFAFDPSKAESYGLDLTPRAAYRLPDSVQGAAIDGATLYLSTSYGRFNFSHILAMGFEGAPSSSAITVLGQEVACLPLEQKGAYQTPPMSEEIEIVGGKLYAVSEFASNKHFFGKLLGAGWCYATDLSYFS